MQSIQRMTAMVAAGLISAVWACDAECVSLISSRRLQADCSLSDSTALPDGICVRLFDPTPS